jgi:hypothetical protein
MALIENCCLFVGVSRYKIIFLEPGVIRMTKKATKRRAWTAEQVRTLKTMARQKKRASHIAKTLKRTEGATRQKAFSMGLSLDTRA